MKIPLNDLRRFDSPWIEKIEESVRGVVRSGSYILGNEVNLFEKEFADYCEVKSCIGVASGTDALILALKAAGIGPGAKVATVANAGFYSTLAILSVGAEPLYVDINSSTMLMSGDDLKSKLTPEVKAIILTHLYGNMSSVEEISNIGKNKNILLIEDCAQAHGASYIGRKAGAWGLMGCFSFYPTKNLGAMGDGGAIVTNDKTIEGKIRELRQYGWSDRYVVNNALGFCSRMDEIQAAILRVKLKYLNDFVQTRIKIANKLNEGLRGCEIELPKIHQLNHAMHLYVAQVKNRDKFQTELNKEGIQTSIHYPIPDHKQKSIQNKKFTNCELPITESVIKDIVTLPCFPGLQVAEIKAIIETIKKNYGS